MQSHAADVVDATTSARSHPAYALRLAWVASHSLLLAGWLPPALLPPPPPPAAALLLPARARLSQQHCSVGRILLGRQRGFCDARCSRRILQPPAMQPCMNTTCWLARLRCNRCSGMGSRRLPAYDVLVLDLVQAGIAAQVLVDDVPVRLY